MHSNHMNANCAEYYSKQLCFKQLLEGARGRVMAAPREPDPLRVWLGNLGPGISKAQIASCLSDLGVESSDTNAIMYSIVLTNTLHLAL